MKDDAIRATLFGSRFADFKLESTVPKEPVLINPTTQLVIGRLKMVAKPATLSYEDIGGLGQQLHRIREMIELPLRYPEVFERLGIQAPKGVFFTGLPDAAKHLSLAPSPMRRRRTFFSVSGPEVVHKFYGESEAHLSQIFAEATKKGPEHRFPR